MVLDDWAPANVFRDVLDSEEGYVAWIERQLIEEQTDDERQKNDVLAKETRGPFLRYLLVKRALVSALASVPGPSPQTISVLTALADKCMTEVEDVFLAEADYGEDRWPNRVARGRQGGPWHLASVSPIGRRVSFNPSTILLAPLCVATLTQLLSV